MASASFTVNGSATPPEVEVTANSTVTLALTDTSFRTVTWSIVGKHHPDAATPTITPAGTPLGATATFTMPNVAGGQAYLVEAVVNNGVDDAGQSQANLTKRALIGVVSAAGSIPFASGEKNERHAEYGWTLVLNELLHSS